MALLILSQCFLAVDFLRRKFHVFSLKPFEYPLISRTLMNNGLNFSSFFVADKILEILFKLNISIL